MTLIVIVPPFMIVTGPERASTPPASCTTKGAELLDIEPALIDAIAAALTVVTVDWRACAPAAV